MAKKIEMAVEILTPLYDAMRSVCLVYEDEWVGGAARKNARAAWETVRDVLDCACGRVAWVRHETYDDVITFVEEYKAEVEASEEDDKAVVIETCEIIHKMLTEGETIRQYQRENSND